MKIYIYKLFILIFLISSITQAQDKVARKVTKDYNNLAYVKTSEVLLEVAKNGYESKDLLQKLGNSFYFNNKMEDASIWYSKLVALDEDIDSEYYFRYAQSLKFIENYTEADKWMQKFYDSKPSDIRAKAFVLKEDYLSEIETFSRDIVLKNLDINSRFSDFGTTQYNNQLIIASARGGGELYKWNEQPFLDLYSTNKQDNGSYGTVLPFSDAINTQYHESTASFSPKEDNIYFTRNDFFKNKLGKDENRINRLQIFRAQRSTNNTWGDVKSIHFNSDMYSVAHPVVNTNGTKLYFASDMPGTVGKSDLYVANINDDGSLGEPINLGSKINTEGLETFPFINSKGDLYFSSNGFPGLGGLDIYVIKDFETLMANDKSGNFVVKNIGKPINSAQDDFGYYENLETKEGFFTSNRLGGKGDDDIYSFIVPDCKQLINGIVKDKDSQEQLSEVVVILSDESGLEIEREITGKDATFSFAAKCEQEYLIRTLKNTFHANEERITTLNEDVNMDVFLKKNEQEVMSGDDLAKVLDIPIIYFDLDKSNIRPDAEVELQKVIVVLKQHPEMKLDVRSHTDSRATSTYNMALSKRRNKSTMSYIINVGGIDSSRLTGNGYGESQLVNNCSDGVKCSEEEHELNRRSEFIVVNN
jgi:outer membrane protein OmpA-like peptidoglycan-associated protein/tetratricopeptide (TPR) repeat protein